MDYHLNSKNDIEDILPSNEVIIFIFLFQEAKKDNYNYKHNDLLETELFKPDLHLKDSNNNIDNNSNSNGNLNEKEKEERKFYDNLINVIVTQENIIDSCKSNKESLEIFNNEITKNIMEFKLNSEKYGKYLRLIKNEFQMISDLMR